MQAKDDPTVIDLGLHYLLYVPFPCPSWGFSAFSRDSFKEQATPVLHGYGSGPPLVCKAAHDPVLQTFTNWGPNGYLVFHELQQPHSLPLRVLDLPREKVAETDTKNREETSRDRIDLAT